MSDMTGKICVVTGANSGIGKETALTLAKKGATVVMACRNKERGEAALADIRASSESENVELILVDVGEVDSVDAFATEFNSKYDRLDVLVNNAGVWVNDRRENSQGYEMMFAINHLGYFMMVHRLLPALRASEKARIVNVSSEAHRAAKPNLEDVNWNNRGYKSVQAYGDSKLFNIWFTSVLAERVDAKEITVNCLHPGTIKTNLADGGLIGFLAKLTGPFLKTTTQGAQTQIFLATSPDVKDITGKYFSNSREKKPNALAKDLEKANALWGLSEKMLGIDSFGEEKL